MAGYERDLGLTPLAQWMRDTTGIPSDFDVTPYLVSPDGKKRHAWIPPETRTEPAIGPTPFSEGGTSPHHRVRGSIPQRAEIATILNTPPQIDPNKLYRAAHEAVQSFIAEGRDIEEVMEHERRIWKIYHDIMEKISG